jgi:hypothetical protein
LRILGAHLGRPVRAEAVLKEMQVFQPVAQSPSEPLDLARVRIRLSRGAKLGLWLKVGHGPGNVGYAARMPSAALGSEAPALAPVR